MSILTFICCENISFESNMWVQKAGFEKIKTFKWGPNWAYYTLTISRFMSKLGSCQASRDSQMTEMGTELFAVYILNFNILLKDLIFSSFRTVNCKPFTWLSLGEIRCTSSVGASRTRASSTTELLLLTQVSIFKSLTQVSIFKSCIEN